MNTLNQYYQSKNMQLPSIQDRRATAETFGIQNYAGTAEQNSLLLNKLSGLDSGSPVSLFKPTLGTQNTFTSSTVQPVIDASNTILDRYQAPPMEFFNTGINTALPKTNFLPESFFEQQNAESLQASQNKAISGNYAISSPQLGLRNNNPGNLRFINQQGASMGEKNFAKFNTLEEGFNALVNDVKAKQTGNTRTGLNGNSTLAQFFKIYAPSADNNNPEAYANTVAKKLGIDPN
jgi:hypothetical protein